MNKQKTNGTNTLFLLQIIEKKEKDFKKLMSHNKTNLKNL